MPMDCRWTQTWMAVTYNAQIYELSYHTNFCLFSLFITFWDHFCIQLFVSNNLLEMNATLRHAPCSSPSGLSFHPSHTGLVHSLWHSFIKRRITTLKTSEKSAKCVRNTKICETGNVCKGLFMLLLPFHEIDFSCLTLRAILH